MGTAGGYYWWVVFMSEGAMKTGEEGRKGIPNASKFCIPYNHFFFMRVSYLCVLCESYLCELCRIIKAMHTL